MTAHRLVLLGRGPDHVHRHVALCACGWQSPRRRRRRDVERIYRSHLNAVTGHARRVKGRSLHRALTPFANLPEALR